MVWPVIRFFVFYSLALTIISTTTVISYADTKNIDQNLCNFTLTRIPVNASQEILDVFTKIKTGVARLSVRPPDYERMSFLRRGLSRALQRTSSLLLGPWTPTFVENTYNFSHLKITEFSETALTSLGLGYSEPGRSYSRTLRNSEPPPNVLIRIKGLLNDGTPAALDGYILSTFPLIVLVREGGHIRTDLSAGALMGGSVLTYITPYCYHLARLDPSLIKSIELIQPNLREPMAPLEFQSLLRRHPEIRLLSAAEVEEIISAGSARGEDQRPSSPRILSLRNRETTTDLDVMLQNAAPDDLFSIHVGWWRPLVGTLVEKSRYIFKIQTSFGDRYVQLMSTTSNEDLPEHIAIVPGSRPTEALRHLRNDDRVVTRVGSNIRAGRIHFLNDGSIELITQNDPNDGTETTVPLSTNDLIDVEVRPDPTGVAETFLRFINSSEHPIAEAQLNHDEITGIYPKTPQYKAHNSLTLISDSTTGFVVRGLSHRGQEDPQEPTETVLFFAQNFNFNFINREALGLVFKILDQWSSRSNLSLTNIGVSTTASLALRLVPANHGNGYDLIYRVTAKSTLTDQNTDYLRNLLQRFTEEANRSMFNVSTPTIRAIQIE